MKYPFDEYYLTLCIHLMPESRFPLIAFLLVLIATFAIYGIILLPGYTFAGMDFLNLTYPRTGLAREAMVAGHLPLWNWYEWGGAPLLATSLGALCYPFTWIAAAMPLPYGLQFFVLFHILIVSFGAMALCRRILRASWLAAAAAAIIYGGNAFFVGRIEQSQVIAVNAWLPWLILAVWRAVFRRYPERPWVAVVWSLTLLAGHPQFAAFNVLAAVGFVGLVSMWAVGRARWNLRTFLSRWWRVGWQLILGAALAAVQLLPTWELGQLSERIWPYPNPTTPELAWRDLPALIVPHYYNFMTGQTGRVMGYTELGLYAGVLAFPLAVAGLCWALFGRNSLGRTANVARRRVVIVAAIVWLAAVVFALGDHAGLASIVYTYFPFFKQSRGAARSLNIAALMLAILSAQGLVWLSSAIAQRGARVTDNGQLHTRTIGSRWQKANTITALLCVLVAADIAITQLPALKSILTPVGVLKTKALMPDDVRDMLQSTNARVYRFMAFDSDLYLNNSVSAVAERFARFQPNLNSLDHIGLIDGYEEGLLPLRARANLFRKYNRNLRGPSPDASLLAVMGSNLMFSEYPLMNDGLLWKAISPVYLRSSVVPSLDPSTPPGYQWWQSAYPTARVYSLRDLLLPGVSSDDFLRQARLDFPLNDKRKSPPAFERRRHVFSEVSPERFMAAARHFQKDSDFSDWNHLAFTVTSHTSTALVMLSPYPGWQISERDHRKIEIKPLNSLCYELHFPNNVSVPYPVTLSFEPFSFRLGLFFSLVAAAILLFLFIAITEKRSGKKLYLGSQRSNL